jgi:hypothetical protein
MSGEFLNKLILASLSALLVMLLIGNVVNELSHTEPLEHNAYAVIPSDDPYWHLPIRTPARRPPSAAPPATPSTTVAPINLAPICGPSSVRKKARSTGIRTPTPSRIKAVCGAMRI